MSARGKVIRFPKLPPEPRDERRLVEVLRCDRAEALVVKGLFEDPAHLAAFVREKRRAHDLRGRDRLRQSGPRADEFLQALAGRGAPLAPQTLALLQGAVSEEKAT